MFSPARSRRPGQNRFWPLLARRHQLGNLMQGGVLDLIITKAVSDGNQQPA
jgi:hypothetical protein